MPQDNIEAYRWFDLSAFLATSTERRELAAGYRDSLMRHMTSRETDEARNIACNWWRQFKPPESRKFPDFPGCVPNSR